MKKERGYQRAHLRAPFRGPVLFGDGDYIHKARAVNLSEGGLLLDELPEFPAMERVPLMLQIPTHTYFKNFTLIKLQTFSPDLLPAKVIRAQAQMVRRLGATTDVDDVFQPRFGIQFLNLGEAERRIINEYVSVFASNLIYLQMLIDSWNTDEDIRLKTRALADVLGYTSQSKVAELRHAVTLDYRSLQWL
jgi:hypothetical protein